MSSPGSSTCYDATAAHDGFYSQYIHSSEIPLNHVAPRALRLTSSNYQVSQPVMMQQQPFMVFLIIFFRLAAKPPQIYMLHFLSSFICVASLI